MYNQEPEEIAHQIKQKAKMNFKQGSSVSFLTSYDLKTFQVNIKWDKIGSFFTRIQYNSCLYSDIFKCTYRMVKHHNANFSKLISIKLFDSGIHNQYLGKLLKVLLFCINLEDVYFNFEKNWKETSFANLHLFMAERATQENSLNSTIMNLYDTSLALIENKYRLGYILEKISLNCKEYFFTHTNEITNVFFMKHFLRAADSVARRKNNHKPIIYLGDYISEENDTTYSEYSYVLKSGNISLKKQLPNELQFRSDQSCWVVLPQLYI